MKFVTVDKKVHNRMRFNVGKEVFFRYKMSFLRT